MASRYPREMEILRTPDERFAGLPGYPFAPHYAEIGELRMHYVDEGPRDGAARAAAARRAVVVATCTAR